MKNKFKPNAAVLAATTVATVTAFALPSCSSQEENKIEPLFQPTLESMEAHFQAPEWYEDAKFGIFTHWGPQCVPESGDWYARNMYIPNHWHFNRHREKYGDQKTFGFKDVIHTWNADKWDPQDLAKLFKSMGAKYVVSLANHHDNFDLWDSKYQEWNSVRIGPKRDIIGEWSKAVRGEGLHWGVSVHASHAWNWYETSRPYDGLLTKEDGAGTWWGEMGLDPQELYAQQHEASKDSGHWNWNPDIVPPPSQEYRDKFMKRHKQLIDDYLPEVLYYDDTVAPFYPTFNDGIELTTYFYNKMYRLNGDKQEVVACSKVLNEEQRKGMVWDIECGVPNEIVKPHWQTDTCIGNWHYDRGIYDRNGYKTPETVVRMLIDIVSKGGNLLLSVPIRGNGEVDEKVRATCAGVGAWMKVNGEGIYGTDTWKKYGAGPQAEDAGVALRDQGFNEGKGKAATTEDLRFTTKNGKLYVFTLLIPKPGAPVVVTDLDAPVKSVKLFGSEKPVKWTNENGVLTITAPDADPNLKISLCYEVEFEKK